MNEENVDYKKLLKKCIEHWFFDEGSAWDGEDDELSDDEKKAYNRIHKETYNDLESGKLLEKFNK